MQGQQLPIYSQYLYNKFLINPAVAGSEGFTSLNLTARQQWVGYSGAPQTFSLSIEGRILKKGLSSRKGSSHSLFRPGNDGKVGVGAVIYNDRNGLVQRTGFQVSYAYHTWLNSATQLSMGLSFNGCYYKINVQDIVLEDPNDPILNSDFRHGVFIPDVTFGTYLLNSKYNLGFSADQLLQAVIKIGGNGYKNLKIVRNYNLFGSYDFQMAHDFIFQPNILFMMSEQLKPMADIGVTVKHGLDYWAGLTYRTSGAMIANIGYKYKNILIGYSIDYSLSEIQRLTYGTHEISLAMRFGDSARRYRWLDRY